MADNVTADPGTGGATFATDDIGGVHYPITKIAQGALDSQTLVSTAAPFPIVSASSGLIQLSSQITVTATGPVTISSGTVTLSSAIAISSGTITSTAATNPWSSAPTFNIPMVSASSGAIQISSGTVTLSSAPLVIVASSGGTQLVQSTAGTNPWSSAPGFNVPMVSASSGVIQLSSAPLVVVASSGGTQLVQTTAATNPWSSAPGFNVPMVSASSGVLQAYPLTVTAAGFGPVTSSAGTLVSLMGYGSSSRLRVVTSVGSISTSPGVLHFVSAYTTGITGVGAYMRIYDLTTNNATSSSSAGLAGAAILRKVASSAAGLPADATTIWPQGVKFATACSFDLVASATSTAAALAGWVSAQYTTMAIV